MGTQIVKASDTEQPALRNLQGSGKGCREDELDTADK
jgi:hypothetical protein